MCPGRDASPSLIQVPIILVFGSVNEVEISEKEPVGALSSPRFFMLIEESLLEAIT